MCITLENRGAKFTKAAIKNDELREYANMLAQDAMNIRANLLHISAIMATIASKRDTGILEEFDNSIAVFAEKRLGIKKSQAYSMVSVGATFLDSNGKSLLPEKGGKWSNTQFMALLPMGGTGKNKKTPEETLSACVELVKDGSINPGMTVTELKSVIAEKRPDAKAKQIAAEKRKAKADAKAAAEEKMDHEEETATIPGVKIGTIGVYQLEDGSIQIAWDGVVKPFNQANIDKLVQLLQNAANFKS